MSIFGFGNKKKEIDNRLQEQEDYLNRILNIKNITPTPSPIKKQDTTIITKIDKNLSIFDQAAIYFKPVLGLEPIKQNLYCLLRSPHKKHALLVGPAATSKSLFMNCIRKNESNVLYFDAASGTSAAGMIRRIKANRNAKIIIIDELDKFKRGETNVILNLLENGTIDKDLKGENIHVEMPDVQIFATANSTAKLSDPFMSRMQVYELPEYDDKMFMDVVVHCLEDITTRRNSEIIGNVLLAKQKKNVRLAISIGSMIIDGMSEQEVLTIIANYLQFSLKDRNVDYN